MQPKKNSTTEQQCPVYNTWTYASKNNLFCFFSSVRDIKAVLFVQSGNNVSTLQLYLPLRLDFSVKTMSHFAAKCPSEAERIAKKRLSDKIETISCAFYNKSDSISRPSVL